MYSLLDDIIKLRLKSFQVLVLDNSKTLINYYQYKNFFNKENINILLLEENLGCIESRIFLSTLPQGKDSWCFFLDDDINFQNIKISSLLIYAAKIDENYSDKEKNIIKNFLNSINANINSDEIIKLAEKEEQNSNQILNFTQEIKKNSLDFKKKIIETLWQIILSDEKADMYEATLMRRISGLLYLPDKLIGEIKLKVLKNK